MKCEFTFHFVISIILGIIVTNIQVILSEATCQLRLDMNRDDCETPYQSLAAIDTHVEGEFNESGGAISVPDGTSCLVFIPGEDTIVVCIGGTWLTTEVYRYNDSQSRRKRATFTITRWHNNEAQLADTGGPAINCPSINTPIYAERGEVTAVVSWKLPDTNNGTVSLVQTQGQAPGTPHREGDHVVSYITRDAKGQAAICSVTFEVVVRKCPHEFTYMLNGSVTCTPSSNKYIYGSECSYSCSQGYTLIGQQSLQCESNGTWNGDRPSCAAISCESPGDIEHGNLICETSQHTFLSKCEVVCDGGYTFVGQEVITTCQANGEWTPTGECQVKLCPELESVENLNKNCSNNYSSICAFTCDQQYLLTGESTLTCQENGNWSASLPECVRLCPQLPDVPHGNFTCRSRHQYQDICTLVCDGGYKVTGPLNITCDSNMQWTNSGSCLDVQPPVPVEDCPSDIEVTAKELGSPNLVTYSIPHFTDNSGDSVDVVGSPPPGSAFPLGASTVIITATDMAGNNVTCQFVLRVTAKLCRDPHSGLDPSDPIQFDCPNGFAVGAVCNVSCNDGKEPKKKNPFRCGFNIYYREPEWNSTGDYMPYCQEQCGRGQWSPSGMQPCNLCGLGAYQAEYGSTKCQLCPYMMITPIYGAISKEQCQFVDYTINPALNPPIIQLNDTDPPSFTIMIWINTNPDNPRTTLNFTVNPKNVPLGAAYLSLDNFAIYVYYIENSPAISIKYWYHVAIVFDRQGDGGVVKLYVDGDLKETVSGVYPNSLSGKSVSVGFTGTLIYFLNNPLLVSGFQMTRGALTLAQVQQFHTTCKKPFDDNFLGANETYRTRLTTCDDVDNCAGSPCGQHGTCFDGDDTFTCACTDYWSGKTCQFPPDFCVNNTCSTGATCVNHIEFSNFTCICADGFKGPLCKDKTVNGGWGAWEEWSTCSEKCGSGRRRRVRMCDNPRPDPSGEICHGDQEQEEKCFGNQCQVNGVYGDWSDFSPCSAICGGGESFRSRVCDSPAPKYGGSPCLGSEVGSIACNAVACPECTDLKLRSGHQDLSCTKNADKSLTTCQIIGKPGLTMVPSIVNRFQCGLVTNYTWTHQTVLNPTAMLPDCAELTQPTKSRIVIRYRYDNVKNSKLSSTDVIAQTVQQNVLQLLSCNSTECSYKVAVTAACDGNNPVTGKLQVEITNKLNMSTSNVATHLNLNISAGEYGNTVTEMSQMLEDVLVNTVNTSADILKACVLGTNVTDSIATAQLVIDCREGSGYSDNVCVDCPPGSYSAGNGFCILCEKMFYQDQSRMTFCKPCPDCSSTEGQGSFTIDQCRPFICSNISNSGDEKLQLIIGLAVGIGGFFIFATVLVIIIQKNYRKRKVEHPYDIPGDVNLRDEIKDDPYDIIDEPEYIAIQDLPGDLSTVGSDGYSKPINEQDFSGGNSTFKSDGYIKPIDEQDFSGGNSTFKSDGYIKPIDEQDFSGGSSTFKSDGYIKPIDEQDFSGGSSTFKSDGYIKPIDEQDFSGGSSTFKSDGYIKPIDEQDFSGGSSTFKSDGYIKPIDEQDFSGDSSTFKSDGYSKSEGVQDFSGGSSTFKSDGLSKPEDVHDISGDSSTFRSEGNLKPKDEHDNANNTEPSSSA